MGDVFHGRGGSNAVGRSLFSFSFLRFIHLYIPWVPGTGVWLSIPWLWTGPESCFPWYHLSVYSVRVLCIGLEMKG
jgi:hypothetical protein